MSTSSHKNTQKKIGKVRPPRVQITYDVETGGATKQKSLPFVVGVVADLSPGASATQTPLRDRAFIEIDNDNFDKVMAAQKPTVNLSVPNKLSSEKPTLRVDLTFSSMDDFSPSGIVKAIPELKALTDQRDRLNELLAKLEGNEKLNDLLAEVVLNTEVQGKAISEVEERKHADGDAS
jgi:type VI secretion system protein ImpB